MYGAFLLEVRRSRGMTQGQLAEVSGISQPNLSAYERDRRIPSAATLNRLLVSCGYQLAAVAGTETITCPLPRIGWFPDDDMPPGLADDPPDEPPLVTSSTPIEEHLAIMNAMLAAVDEAWSPKR